MIQNLLLDTYLWLQDLVKVEIPKDLEKNFRAILQSMFAKLDLITREEFDVQKKVLTKTRAKINALEKQVVHLEHHLSKSKPKKGVK